MHVYASSIWNRSIGMDILRIIFGLMLPVLILAPDTLAQDDSGRDRQRGSFDFGHIVHEGSPLGDLNMVHDYVPLEGPIDADEYIVGPNDIFSVSVGGNQATQGLVTISADGSLILPQVGSIPVSGKTLRETKSLAENALKSYFEHVDVQVSLATPRQFYVHVSGTVPSPGRHIANPVTRLAGVLAQSLAGSTEGDSFRNISGQFRPSLRNIMITRRNGERLSVDLYRYLSGGDLEHNPYLSDGDVIHIPSFQPVRDALFITGDIVHPGEYDFRTGDTVMDALMLATGSPETSRLLTIRITRRGSDGPNPIEIDAQELLAGNAENHALRPLDQIHIGAEKAAGAAHVHGAVTFPGIYPIDSGETTLQELLEKAGGLLPEAHARAAFIERNRPGLARTDLPNTDLGFLGRVYLANELQENRLAVNLEDVIAGTAEEIPLYDGDRIQVPRDDHSILVTGHVARGGYMQYRSDFGVEDYINAAGGRGPGARETYLVRAGSREWSPADGRTLRSGDIIFVDRQEAADSPELQQLALIELNARREARISTTQTILAAVTTLTSVLTTYVLIRDRR